MSDLKTQLLEQRDILSKELHALETFLSIRFGWTPTDTQVAPTPIQQQTENISTSSQASISYRFEAEEWLKSVQGTFTANDFKNWLCNKFGPQNVNEDSVRGPFPSLVERKLISIVRQGAGRAPSVYRKAE